MSLEPHIEKFDFTLPWAVNRNFIKFLVKNKQKTGLVLLQFLRDLKDEAVDTKEASYIIGNYLFHQKITKKEEQLLKQQVYDKLKIIGIGIPFMMIPGASFLIPLLVKIAKKKGINLMPSNFDSSYKKKLLK